MIAPLPQRSKCALTKNERPSGKGVGVSLQRFGLVVFQAGANGTFRALTGTGPLSQDYLRDGDLSTPIQKAGRANFALHSVKSAIE